MRVVTGASGHVGGAMVRALVDRDGPGQVGALYRGRRGTAAHLDVAWRRGDLDNEASLTAAFEGAEVVYHLAALVSVEPGRAHDLQQTNVLGTRRVVAAALRCGVRRLVHMSSIHAYDHRPQDEVLDERRRAADGSRHDGYARSKVSAEAEVRRGIDRGLDAVILNPTSVLGPYDGEPSAMGRVLLDLYHRRMPALVAGGYDWVDVRDVAAAALAAETRGRSGENYIVSGGWRTVRELAQFAQQATGVPAPRLQVPATVARLWAPWQVALDRARGRRPLYTPAALRVMVEGARRISSVKARTELGHRPRSLALTVRDAYRWFDEQGMLEPTSA